MLQNEYHNKISWFLYRQTAFIMIAETISLGILSLPSVLAAVGLVPYVPQINYGVLHELIVASSEESFWL